MEIYAPGHVYGNIEAPQMFLDKGAVFKGQCTMTEEKSSSDETPMVEEAGALP